MHVLRVKSGDSIELIDGSGRIWRGDVAVISLAPLTVTIDGLAELAPTDITAVRLTLIQSLCKAEKLEWILEKTTELGIAEIRLLAADRSVLKVPEQKAQAKVDRWTKIIAAAAKQSRRSTLPVLHAPADCQTICESLEADLKLVLSEDEKRLSLRNVLQRSTGRSAAFWVGPEGGWSPEEQQIFRTYKLEQVTLGGNILRTETAAIVGTALLKYELDNLNLTG
jgi:16S rRNA (uracil1498-N3)-methyltransferase